MDRVGLVGIYASFSGHVSIEECQVNGSLGLVMIIDTSDSTVTGCHLRSGMYALSMADCTNVTVTLTDVSNATIGIWLESSRGVVIDQCLLDVIGSDAILIANGTQDCTILNVTVISAHTAVHITGQGTMGNRVHNLSASNVQEAVNVSAAVSYTHLTLPTTPYV